MTAVVDLSIAEQRQGTHTMRPSKLELSDVAHTRRISAWQVGTCASYYLIDGTFRLDDKWINKLTGPAGAVSSSSLMSEFRCVGRWMCCGSFFNLLWKHPRCTYIETLVCREDQRPPRTCSRVFIDIDSRWTPEHLGGMAWVRYGSPSRQPLDYV